jgi:hypothetical protein
VVVTNVVGSDIATAAQLGLGIFPRPRFKRSQREPRLRAILKTPSAGETFLFCNEKQHGLNKLCIVHRARGALSPARPCAALLQSRADGTPYGLERHSFCSRRHSKPEHRLIDTWLQVKHRSSAAVLTACQRCKVAQLISLSHVTSFVCPNSRRGGSVKQSSTVAASCANLSATNCNDLGLGIVFPASLQRISARPLDSVPCPKAPCAAIAVRV